MLRSPWVKTSGPVSSKGSASGGATWVVSMNIVYDCILSYVKLAVEKRRKRGVIRKWSTCPVKKQVTIAILRGICNGARNRRM
jgi:hypothetical protein